MGQHETILQPMSDEVFAEYLEGAIASYAKSNVDSGNWPADEALEYSRADHDKLLPQGAQTPDHYLFEIKEAPGGTTVGTVWFAVLEARHVRTAFVYDLRIGEEHRRHGHATAAMEQVERHVREMGATRLGLHVFAFNSGAQALYEKLGFEVLSHNLQKTL